jgi:Amt family ammonium transporter
MGALAIGLAAGVGCFYSATRLKRAFGYDDSLDVFGVHAVGGIIGALLAGVFAATTLGGSGFADGVNSISDQVFNQAVGIMVTLVYSGSLSFIILKVIDIVMGLRVTTEEEEEGLDLSSHDERGYVL